MDTFTTILEALMTILQVMLASHWSILLMLSSHWSILREPVVRVVNMPHLPPQHPLAQNGTPRRNSRAISQNGTRRNSEITHAELSEHLKSELVQKWQRKLGSKYQIIVSSSTERKRVDSQDFTFRWVT